MLLINKMSNMKFRKESYEKIRFFILKMLINLELVQLDLTFYRNYAHINGFQNNELEAFYYRHFIIPIVKRSFLKIIFLRKKE